LTEKSFNNLHESYSSDFINSSAALPNTESRVIKVFDAQYLKESEVKVGNLRSIDIFVACIL
jgi:hypothetical protein